MPTVSSTFHKKILSYGFKLVPSEYGKVYQKKLEGNQDLELIVSDGVYCLHFTEKINGKVDWFILAHRYEVKNEHQLDFLIRGSLRVRTIDFNSV